METSKEGKSCFQGKLLGFLKQSRYYINTLNLMYEIIHDPGTAILFFVNFGAGRINYACQGSIGEGQAR